MAENNLNPIKGVIYKIDSQEIPNKKDPENPWKKRIITLEVTTTKNGSYTDKDGESHETRKTFPEFPQIEAFGSDMSHIDNSFYVGDTVEIWFQLRGKKYTKKVDGTEGIFNSSSLKLIKHTDVDYGKKRNEDKVDPVKTETSDVFSDRPAFEDNDDVTDLPF